jgi:hypothetical protein
MRHSSFWSCTLSNTSFVLINVAHGLFADLEKEMHLPSYNFCLKKRLGEPAQFKTMLQFGRAHQPVRTNPQRGLHTQGIRVIGRLSSIAAGVF